MPLYQQPTGAYRMGLDQYIHRLTPGEVHHREITDDEGKVLYEWWQEGYAEVASFRKVNFLHKWVEDHLNGGRESNSEEIPFHLEAMAGLMDTCARVLAEPERGPELLPTMGRFFFGSEEYDEYYLKDVGEVLDALATILTVEKANYPAPPGQYTYYSSW